MDAKTLRAIILTALITSALVTANFYNGLNKGVSWNWGGVEIIPQPALYICTAHYDTKHNRSVPNPIAPYFPELATEC